MALSEDLTLCGEVMVLRDFVRVVGKQGKASQFSGGLGSLTPDEEAWLDSIQEALDARTAARGAR